MMRLTHEACLPMNKTLFMCFTLPLKTMNYAFCLKTPFHHQVVLKHSKAQALILGLVLFLGHGALSHAAVSTPAFKEGIIRELAEIGSPSQPFEGGSFSAAIPSENGTQGVVPVEGLENLSVATQVTVAKATKWPWDAQVSAKSAVPIPKDTVLYATFFARWAPAQKAVGGQSGGNIRVDLKDLDAASGASPINRIQPEISETWQRYHLRGVVVKDIAAGRGELLFSLGSLPQTIEVAGVTILAFPPGTELKRLPRNILNLDYAGRAADAPWRVEAAKKIDEIRKGDLTVSVRDSKGQPVPGASVRIGQTRHSFEFGTALAANLFDPAKPSADFDRYLELLKANFNRVTIENHLKPWVPLSEKGDATRQLAEASLAFTQANNIPTFGHVLVWPNFDPHYPREFRELYRNDPEGLRTALRDSVRTRAERYHGQLNGWDVINEPYGNRQFMDILGDAEMLEWFKIAAKATPGTPLYINETCMFKRGGIGEAERQNFERVLKILQDGGAPVHGIGEQAHLGIANTMTPGEITASLDRFARFGLPIHISELDVDIADTSDPEQLAWQRDMFRDALTLFFAHPSVNAITQWGFWEGAHWKKKAALWDKNWNLRAHGQAYRDLVFKDWWTDTTLPTDDKGTARTRGFLGEYKVTVNANGKTSEVTAKLVKGGAALEVVLKE